MKPLATKRKNSKDNYRSTSIYYLMFLKNMRDVHIIKYNNILAIYLLNINVVLARVVIHSTVNNDNKMT